MDANGLVNPRRRVATAHNAAEIAIKGRRLPKRDLELSASMPSKFGVKNPWQPDGETDLLRVGR